MTPEERLELLGIDLPEVSTPVGSYLSYRCAGAFLYLSGVGPKRSDGSYRLGKVGCEVTIEEGCADARLTGLHLLAAAKLALGELSRIESVVKIVGMVNAAPDFSDHPKVINGCSDVLIDVLGEAGQHARSAVGIGSLPGRMTVEIEAIFFIRSQGETETAMEL